MTPLSGTIDEITLQVVTERLALYRGHRQQTADSLGIALRTLTLWIKKWKLNSPVKKGRPMANDTPHQTAAQPAMVLRKIDLSTEAWREYTWMDPEQATVQHKTRFDSPLRVEFAVPGTTHRVVVKDKDGNEVAHCLPAPGYMGCVLSWAAKEGMPLITA